MFSPGAGMSGEVDRWPAWPGEGKWGTTPAGVPVSWPVYERHRSFRYTGGLRAVTYRPGDPAPYDPETVARALREAAAAFE